MSVKFYDSELRVMEVLWERGDCTAKEIAEVLNEKIGWNVNTTYTVIKKCISKGAVERYGKNFMCKALVNRNETQLYEIKELIKRMFGGSKAQFFNTFIKSENLTEEEMKDMRDFIKKLE